jgi:preprotein translocase subunit SecG
MQTILIVIHLMVVIALVIVVLLQRSEGGALGMGGGGGFMTGRGQTTALTRATAILATIFFATSIGLTLLANWGRAPTTSVIDKVAPAQTAPAGSDLLDQLKSIDQRAPAAPK